MTNDEIKSLTAEYVEVQKEYLTSGTKGTQLKEAGEKLKAALIANGSDVQQANAYLNALYVDIAPGMAF